MLGVLDGGFGGHAAVVVGGVKAVTLDDAAGGGCGEDVRKDGGHSVVGHEQTVESEI